MHFWLYVSSHNNFIALALEFCGRPNIHTFTYTYIVSIECSETVFCNATKREKGVGNVQMYAHRHTYTAWECCMNSSSFVANISSESLPCIFVPHSLLRWDPEKEKHEVFIWRVYFIERLNWYAFFNIQIQTTYLWFTE